METRQITNTADLKAYHAYYHNNDTAMGKEDFNININIADTKSKAKDKVNPSTVSRSLQTTNGMTKGEEFLTTKGVKERKCCVVNVASIQVVKDDSSDEDSIDNNVPELQDPERDEDSSSDKDTP